MEKRINNKIDNWTNTFKDDLRDYIVQNKVELFNGGADNQLEKLIGFVYKYGSLSLSNDDFMKRKRVKNTVPYFERCKAKRASGEQCTRRRKTDEGDSCMFCGTHIKGTPHGVVTSSEENVESIKTVTTWAQDFNGIVYYIDKDHNVYKAEDIYQNIKNPKVIAKYEVDAAGNYTIPSLFES